MKSYYVAFGGMDMKKHGMIRAIDALGRIVIPKEWRKVLDIKPGDSLEMFFCDGNIEIKKYEPMCIFCQGTHNIREYKGKNVCEDCVKNLLSGEK